MKNIQIDSRQCGGGKTTGEDGIYELITKYSDEKILLVLGSISLQEQYQKVFKHLYVINTTTSTLSVIKETKNAMDNQYPLIAITQQAFKLLEISNIQEDYILIIDEAMDNLIEEHECTISTPKNNHVDFKWHKHFELEYDEGQITYEDWLLEKEKANNEDIELNLPNGFYKLTFLGAQDNTPLLSESYRKIASRNKDHYITLYNYNIMVGNNENTDMFHLMTVYNSRLFNKWKNIYVASAAFNLTTMARVFDYNHISYTIEEKKKFNKHTGNIIIHSVANQSVDSRGKHKSFTWSKTKLTNNPEILQSFHDYVNQHANGKAVMSLRNVNELSELDNESKLTHNVHGLNKKEWQEITHISMESALRYSNHMNGFIKQVIFEDKDDNTSDLMIANMSAAYLFYQAIMRCKLRTEEYKRNEQEEIHIYTLDHNVAFLLASEYFETTDIKEIYVEWNTKDAMTNTERNRKCREKKKANKEKKQPMTSTERNRKCREKMKANKEKKQPMTPAERQRKSREKKAAALREKELDKQQKIDELKEFLLENNDE